MLTSQWQECMGQSTNALALAPRITYHRMPAAATRSPNPLVIASRMAKNNLKCPEQLEIWQWNCRTFHKRAAALQNYINSAPISPDVICLQEIGNKPVKLQRYYTLFDPNYPRVATLVSKSITAKVTYYEKTQMNHQIIGILPQKRGKQRTIIVNVYSPPKSRKEDFTELLAEAINVTSKKDQLVVLGDFNAPNTSWGYVRDSPKGTLLE